MATPLTFGNLLKFGPDSCHKAKGRPAFLYREREIKSTQSSVWTPITPYIRERPSNRALHARELSPRWVVEWRHGDGSFSLPIEAGRWQHAWSMCTQTLSMRVHTCVCICMPRVFHDLSFPKIVYLVQKIVLFSTNTFLKSIFIWSGPKLTSSFRILTYWGMGAQVIKGKKRGVYIR